MREMGTEEKRSEGLTKRFDGESNTASKDYERWKRWCRAYLVVQKAKGIPAEAHGSLVFALLDGTALRALDTIAMDRIEVAGGEDVIFQVLDERFPAEASHDRLGKVLDQIFDLKVDKGESTAIYTGKARAAFAAAEAEGVSMPDVAKGYLMLRFARLSPERKAVVLAAARQSYKEQDIAAALRTTYPDNLYQAAKQTATYRVDPEEPMEEIENPSEEDAFDTFLAEAGYATDDEVEEQDAVDALLTWKQTRAGINQTKMSRGFGNAGQAPGRDFKKLESRVRCFRCKQVGHFSKNCPKKGKGGGKSSSKEAGQGSTKVNYVFMVWSNDFFEPEMTISPTGYTVQETLEDGTTLTRHYPPPSQEYGRPLTGQEMQALVTGWEYSPRDFWHVQGNRVIREHLLPRRQLFTPAASGCPVPLGELCETRTTRAVKNNGETSVLFSHNWKHRGEAHRKLDFEWSGQTIFYLREAEIGPTDEELAQLAISYKDELDLAQEELLRTPEDSTESEEDETLVALVHSPGHGVVDTGCGRGLIGEDTLKRHEAVLAEYDLAVKELPHKPHAFRYGNGAADRSFRTVQIPIFLAGVKMWLRMHVVPGQVPLLLSKRFLKALGAVMDLQQGELLLKKAHLTVPLMEQRDGSYQINLLDMKQPAKVRDMEIEVMHTQELWGQCELTEEERSFSPDPLWSPMEDGEEVEMEGTINMSDDHEETIRDVENEHQLGEEEDLPEEQPCLQLDQEQEEEEERYEVESEEAEQDNRTGSQPAEEPEGELSDDDDEGGEVHVMKAHERKALQNKMSQVCRTVMDVDAWPACVEIFCPGRFGEKAAAFGVRGAKTFDLSTGWDWKKADDRKAVWDYLETQDPDLTIMSPPCGPLSMLQNSTPPWRRKDLEQFNREKVEAKAMIAWCARIARDRMRKGRIFVFESSKTSGAWRERGIQDLMGYDECHRVDVPACSVGLRDRESRKLFGKEWGFLTNGPGIVAMLGRLRCTGDHEHQVVEGRSGGQLRSIQTQIYPPKLINMILGGFACSEKYEPLCCPISQADVQLEGSEVSKQSRERVHNAVRKMHVNLGHASMEDMLRILKHHGARSEVLELVKSFQCDVCEARRQPKAVKDSTVPKDLSPLRYIGLGVKWLPTWKKDMQFKALNIVCRASGLQQVYPFKETETSELLVRLYRNWTRAYGRPRYVKFDASRCNLGQPFLDALERDGTVPLDVPGEAHEQMGDVEVQGRHFAQMLTKVMDQMQPDDYPQWLECVDCTIEAKNQLMRRGGYSPNQLVFGRDPEYPGDDLWDENPNPISNGAIVEDAIANFSFRTRQKAREAVLQSLDHRAARIALNSRPRPKREFRPGDEVAVWRRGRGIKKSMARWRGPGIVAGEAGGNYWVSMPGSFVKCSPEQLRLRTASEREADRFLVRDIRAAAAQLFPEVGHSKSTQKNFIDITKDDFPPGDLFPDSGMQTAEPEVAERAAAPEQADMPNPPPSQRGSEPMTISSSLTDQLNQMSEEELTAWRESANRADRLDGHRRPGGSEPEPKRPRQGQLVGGQQYPQSLPLPPQVSGEQVPIQVSSSGSGNQSATTSSSSSSSSRVLFHGVEIVDSATVNVSLNEQGSTEADWILAIEDNGDTIDHSTVLLAGGRKEINLKEPQWNSEEGRAKLIEGIRKEVKNCIQDKSALRACTLEESRQIRHQHPGRIVPSRLVLTPKVDDSGTEIVKARWTARGDKDPDLFALVRGGKTQSPTISSNGRYTVLQAIASNRYPLQLGDVTGAFLETKTLKRDQRLWMSCPTNHPLPDHDKEQLFEVIRPLYGLNDSPQKWYSTFDETVKGLGWAPSKLDPCVYILWDSGLSRGQPQLCGIMGVHVDDVLLGGRGEVFEKSIAQLKTTFPFRKWMKQSGTFCGSLLTQDPETYAIAVSQTEFAESMTKPKLRVKEPPHLTVTPEEASSLKSVLGAGLWLAKETRPDLSVQVSQGQQLLPSPSLGEARSVANITRRAKQHKDLCWTILPIPLDKIKLCLHTDAAFANAKRQGTQAGYIVGITTEELKAGTPAPWSPAVWKSYRLKRVVGSTFAGETQALADGLGHTEWLACHLAELKYPSFSLGDRQDYFRDFGIQAITDCKSIYDHLQTYASPGTITDKRVAIDLVIVKESLKRLWGSIRWAPTWLQLADALTKENADAMDILRGAMQSNVYHLNNESVMLKNAAEQRALRARKKATSETFGSEVWLVQDLPINNKMVKISAKGFTEHEVRALFENMVSRHAKTSEEFLAHMTQSRTMCKAKLPLQMVNSKTFRGETSLVTFTYTKTTQMIAVQAGAAYLDSIEDTMTDVIEKYGAMLKANEILPMREGTGEWSEAFRAVLHEGAHSQFLEKDESEKKAVPTTPLTETTQALTPDDPPFVAAVAELCHEASRKLYDYPAWKQKFLQLMCRDFGADPQMVIELSGLTERFNMSTDDEEGWSVPSEPSNGGPSAKPKPFSRRSLYPRSP